MKGASSPGVAAARVERVRGLRAARLGAGTLGGHLAAAVDGIARRHRALGAVGESWGALVPGALASRAWPESWRRGVLTVRAADASAAFEFDRWLRGGGEASLRGAGVRKVRVAAGA